MAELKTIVLVVDDEIKLCQALSRVLANAGYRVYIAHDGESALKEVKEQKPIVVLLDLMMPGRNGREVCRDIRRLSPLTRVIYFTARAEATGPPELKELRAEADAVIAKPATSARILAEVKRVIQERPPVKKAVRSQSTMKFKE